MATNAILYCGLPLQRGQLFRDSEGSTSRPLTNPVRASLTRTARRNAVTDQSHAGFTDMDGALYYEAPVFPFLLQLMFDQTLNAFIVCLMISHKT